MTRRGSLVYYFAAVVVGCFFLSSGMWVASNFSRFPMERSFLSFYIAAVALGAFGAILTAFLLRRLAGWFHWSREWQWIVLGSVVTPAVVWCLGEIQGLLEDRADWLYPVRVVTLVGPAVVAAHGLWLAIPAGALTAAVLFRVHRAFERREEHGI